MLTMRRASPRGVQTITTMRDSNKPTVINMMLTQELGDPFRRDAFRQPRRLLPKYRKFSARQYR